MFPRKRASTSANVAATDFSSPSRRPPPQPESFDSAKASFRVAGRVCAITGAYCFHQSLCLYGKRDEQKKRINFCTRAIVREYSSCVNCPDGPAKSARCDAAWECRRTGAGISPDRREENARQREAAAAPKKRRVLCRRVRSIRVEPM